MKKKVIVITVFVFLVVVNLPVINTEILKRVDGDHFRYSNADASFTTVQYFDWKQPWMNEWVVWGFIESQRPTMVNMEVFRLYKINPLCFWRWRYYYSVSRDFNYRSWDEIEPKRVPFKGISRWQKF